MNIARVTCSALAALAALSALAHAQGVGYPPDKSPFRDLQYGMNVTPFVSYLDGDGGSLGLGPHDGWIYGATLNLRATKFISLGADVSTGMVQRKLIDPAAPAGQRDKGNIDQRLTVLQALLQLNVTANKTWHRLAPFAGLGVGAAFGSSSTRDSSGYKFGTKFLLTPYGGIRIMPSPRVGIRLEARAPFWKLSYPGRLRDPDDPDEALVTASEWVVSGWYAAGIVIAF